MFTCWKYSERNNRIDYIDNSNSLIKCLFNFHAVFSNNDRKRCVQKQTPETFLTKGDLRDFAKLTGKHLCQSLFFNKVAALRPATLFKKRLWHRCFPVKFVKILRTPFITQQLRPASLLKKRLWQRCFHVNFAKVLRTLFATEHLRWLLLYVVEEKL